MTEFKLRILEAEGTFYDGGCLSIIVPTSEGAYGIQANHEHLIAAVVPGEIKYTLPSGEEMYAAITGGFLKMEDNELLILTEAAEHPEEIDEKRMREEVRLATEEIESKRSIEEYRIAQARMARAINRLKVKNKFKRK
jgi:F-type H+-transporting ATPase subunit epsilon